MLAVIPVQAFRMCHDLYSAAGEMSMAIWPGLPAPIGFTERVRSHTESVVNV